MLTLLAVAAGCIDAASFLGLGQVMTAAMTGNTVLLGLALGQADAEGALRATVALAGFIAGALVGVAIVDRGPSGVWAPAVTTALGLELVVLVILALAWHVLEGGPAWPIDYRHPLIAAAGLAMGIQSAAAQRVGVPGVTTTYITGTLTTMAARLVGWLWSSPAAPGDPVRDIGAPWLQASVWIAYGAGAVFAGAAHLWWPSVALPSGVTAVAGEIRWPSAALLLPIAIVAAVILIAALAYRHRDTRG
ncbi:MAG: YoaK family protein [Geminicoccaceae bacterium]